MNANVVFDPTTPLGSLVIEIMPKAETLPNGRRQLSGTELFVLESKAMALKAKEKAKPEGDSEPVVDSRSTLLDQLLARLGSLRQPAK